MPRAEKLPVLSECALGLMTCITASLSLLPVRAQRVASTAMIGGLFGLMIPPGVLVYGGLKLLDRVYFKGSALAYVGAPLALSYLLNVLAEKTSKRPNAPGTFRSPSSALERRSLAFWSTHFDYFPMTVTPWAPDARLDAEATQYVFGVHPHGIHCWPLNAFALLGSPFDRRFPGLVGARLSGLAATVIFQIPVVRELFLSLGYLDAGRATADKALARGRSLYVCTGGEEESMRSARGVDVVVLAKRKGFVRLALAHGASLVPVFGAGVSDCYQTYPLLLRARMALQKATGIALPIFHGRALTPLPSRQRIELLVGEPIATPAPAARGAKPDDALVDEYHAKYVAALKALHAKHVKDRVLQVV